MIGEPPSSKGGFQDSKQVSGVKSVTSNGPCGGNGLSLNKIIQIMLINCNTYFIILINGSYKCCFLKTYQQQELYKMRNRHQYC